MIGAETNISGLKAHLGLEFSYRDSHEIPIGCMGVDVYGDDFFASSITGTFARLHCGIVPAACPQNRLQTWTTVWMTK